MKNYIYILFGFLIITSCTKDFEEINKNKNKPEEIVPELLLPKIIYGNVDTGPQGSIVVQHFAVRDWSVSLGRYDWWGTPYWDYSGLRNVSNLITEAEKVNNNNFKAIGLIFKVFLFARTTDCVGDIPYSEAIKGKEGVYMPKYDTQEFVYKDMLATLEIANQLLDENGSPIGGDILYDGDILKWKKFANSLHLRLLMRASNKLAEAKTKIKEIVDNPAKYPIFQSNSDMAALTYLSEAPNRNPNYLWQGLDAGEIVMGKPLVDSMLSRNDPRLPIIARPTLTSSNAGKPEYVGVPCGMSKEEAIAYNGGRENQSLVSQRYNHDPVAEKGIFMSYAELQFILAEAAQKLWITKDVKTLYEAGIRASLDYYGVGSKVDDYLKEPKVAFNSEIALNQIGEQKWLSFYFNSGYEPYFDIRRTGIPYLFPGTGNLNDGKIPVRWKYPDSEQNFNNANYKKALEIQGADNVNTVMWLLKK